MVTLLYFKQLTAETNRDIESVKRSLQFVLSNDPSFRSAFGSGAFTLLAPTQTSMSSSMMSVNGRSQQRKMLQLVIPLEVSTSEKAGMVEVQAAFDSGPTSQLNGFSVSCLFKYYLIKNDKIYRSRSRIEYSKY